MSAPVRTTVGADCRNRKPSAGPEYSSGVGPHTPVRPMADESKSRPRRWKLLGPETGVRTGEAGGAGRAAARHSRPAAAIAPKDSLLTGTAVYFAMSKFCSVEPLTVTLFCVAFRRGCQTFTV